MFSFTYPTNCKESFCDSNTLDAKPDNFEWGYHKVKFSAVKHNTIKPIPDKTPYAPKKQRMNQVHVAMQDERITEHGKRKKMQKMVCGETRIATYGMYHSG